MRTVHSYSGGPYGMAPGRAAPRMDCSAACTPHSAAFRAVGNARATYAVRIMAT